MGVFTLKQLRVSFNGFAFELEPLERATPPTAIFLVERNTVKAVEGEFGVRDPRRFLDRNQVLEKSRD